MCSSDSDLELFAQVFSDRVFESVRNSMCPRHFEAFRNFQLGVPKFSERVTKSEFDLIGSLYDVFPRWPEKVNSVCWNRLEVLIQKEAYKPVKNICVPWVEYGKKTLVECEECRIAATFAGVGLNRIEPNPIPEDDSESTFDFTASEEDANPQLAVEDGSDEVLEVINVPDDEEVDGPLNQVAEDAEMMPEVLEVIEGD